MPRRPVARAISLILALIMLAGVLVSSGVAVYRMFFDKTVKVPEAKRSEMQSMLEELARLSAQRQAMEKELGSSESGGDDAANSGGVAIGSDSNNQADAATQNEGLSAE